MLYEVITFNQQYLQKKDDAELARLFQPLLEARGISCDEGYVVITSYSIHYTKLYELIRIFSHDAELLALAAQYSGWIMWLPLVACTAFVWDGIYLGATATREYRNATLVAVITSYSIHYTKLYDVI